MTKHDRKFEAAPENEAQVKDADFGPPDLPQVVGGRLDVGGMTQDLQVLCDSGNEQIGGHVTAYLDTDDVQGVSLVVTPDNEHWEKFPATIPKGLIGNGQHVVYYKWFDPDWHGNPANPSEKSLPFTAVNSPYVTPEYSSAQIVAAASISGGPLTFPPDAGFPTTGFANASFQPRPTGNESDNAKFNWKCSDPCARVDQQGNVQLLSKPSSPFKITATPALAQDADPFVYTVDIKSWFVSGLHYYDQKVTPYPSITNGDLHDLANKLGGKVPSAHALAGLTDEDVAVLKKQAEEAYPYPPSPKSFPEKLNKIGSLYGEWGFPGAYTGEWYAGLLWVFFTDTTFQVSELPGLNFFVCPDLGKGNFKAESVEINDGSLNGFCLMFDV